jgi:hypothetical protein
MIVYLVETRERGTSTNYIIGSTIYVEGLQNMRRGRGAEPKLVSVKLQCMICSADEYNRVHYDLTATLYQYYKMS